MGVKMGFSNKAAVSRAVLLTRVSVKRASTVSV